MKMKKRLLSAIISGALLLGTVPAAASAAAGSLDNFERTSTYVSGQFSDVSSGDWFDKEVGNAFELGLMNGTGAGKFDPNGEVTVTQTVVLAARLHSIYTNDGYSFSGGSNWYQPYIDYAAANGIYNLSGNDSSAASRALFASILSNALPAEALEPINNVTSLPDVSQNDWFGSEVFQLYNAGILTGNDQYGTFAPYTTIKRSAVSAIVARMADRTLRKTVSLEMSTPQPSQPAANEVTLSELKCIELPCAENTAISWYYDDKFATPMSSFITNTLDGYVVLDTPYQEEGAVITATFYDDSFNVVKKKTIPYELPMFGGFYEGRDNVFIAFGQKNMEEDDSKTVIKIVKYDDDLNKVGCCDIKDCFTTEPFLCGTVSMAEYGDILAVNTSRNRYLTSDGNRHQSDLYFRVNTTTMTCNTYMGESQCTHVSHSFNQFAKYDHGDLILLNHGDAYPRSIVLQTLPRETINDRFCEHASVELKELPGPTGYGYTGVFIGGFEISDRNYLTLIRSADLEENYRNYKNGPEYGNEAYQRDESDLKMLVYSRNSGDTSVKEVKLASYIGTGKTAAKPKLVKISGDCFAVLWVEKNCKDVIDGNDKKPDNTCLKYMLVDGSGNQISEVKTAEGYGMNRYCQPMYADGKITWYMAGKNGQTNGTRCFCQIEVK